jgi:DNA replication protein DnaC
MGGGITILAIGKALGELFGPERMKNLLFNMKPELKDKAQNVQLMKFECSQCKEKTIDGWQYELDGEKQQITAATICNSCGTKELSRQVTIELEEKRVGQLISNWWHMNDNDTSGFKNYNVTNSITQKAKDNAIAYTQLFSQNSLKENNLLIMGNPGTGKTHLSKAIARTLKARGFKVGYIPAVELFNKIKATYNGGSTERLFDEMKQLDLLVIDDMGVETTKLNDVSWSVRTWNEIIDDRLGLKNIWTTNLDDATLGDVVGQRTFSRLYENTRFIDLFTDDYRKNKRIT